MTYCIDFFRKFKKEGNFCGLDKSQVSRLMAYLEIVEALIKQKIPEEQIYENFTVQAARPLIAAKGEAHTEGLNHVTAALKKGEKIKTGDLESWINPTISGGSATVKPKKRPPYNGTPQRPPLPVEEPAVKESLTTPPVAPIAQTLKEKYGGNELPASIKKSLTLEPDGSEGFASTPLPPITDITGQVSPPADTPPIPFSTKAPCLSGQPCPDASGRSYIKTEVQRGKVCELWNLPLNQLPGGECPILLRQKKAQEGGFVPAGDIDSITGGKIVRGPPVRITKAPMTVHFEPSPKQANFIHEAIESGKFDTPEQVISQALDLWMDQEGV